jgi:glycosyltransferase involved in cell wall biosynthesis
MHILLINKNESSGGSAQVCQELINGLEAKGISVSFFVDRKESNKKNVFQIKNHKIKKFLSYLTSNDLDYYYGEDILKTDEFKKADIIHLHNISGHFFKLSAIKKMSQIKPIIWTFHDMHPINHYFAYSFKANPSFGLFTGASPKSGSNIIWWNRIYLKLRKLSIYRNTNFNIVSPSIWLQKKIEMTYLKNKNITVINNGINEKNFQPGDKVIARNQLHLPLDKKIILTISDGGKNNVVKGWSFVKEVVNKLDSDDYIILNIGNGKSWTEKNIMFIEKIEERKIVNLYYQAADLLLFPSIADNFPLIVLESMASGTPVVAFNVGGIKEEIDHKINGYLAEYKNSDDLINGINFVYNCEQKELSRKCREKIINQFTSEQMTQKYIELYKKIKTDENSN